jgi:hypothetical protein
VGSGGLARRRKSLALDDLSHKIGRDRHFQCDLPGGAAAAADHAQAGFEQLGQPSGHLFRRPWINPLVADSGRGSRVGPGEEYPKGR